MLQTMRTIVFTAPVSRANALIRLPPGPWSSCASTVPAEYFANTRAEPALPRRSLITLFALWPVDVNELSAEPGKFLRVMNLNTVVRAMRKQALRPVACACRQNWHDGATHVRRMTVDVVNGMLSG